MCGRNCKETTLFFLGVCELIWGGCFTLVALFLVWLGVAWFGDRGADHWLTIPGLIAALSMTAVGVLDIAGSGVCCCKSVKQRRKALFYSLCLRAVPVACFLYVVIVVATSTPDNDRNPSPSPPPLPPAAPGLRPPASPFPAWPPYAPYPASPPDAPYPPSLPPSPPWYPGRYDDDDDSSFGLLFPDIVAIISLAALVIAPILAVLVYRDLKSGDAKTWPSSE